MRCSIGECHKPRLARGWCDKHYQRWKKYGDAEHKVAHRSSGTAEERLREGTEFSMYCWHWKRTKNDQGYGLIQIRYRAIRAHRLAYELAKGPIPQGLVIDHMCHNRGCVNPLHLQAVTQKQNTENPKGPKLGSTTGIVGVSWDKERQKYTAGVAHNGKRYSAGRFDNIEEAAEAVIRLRNKFFTNNLNDRNRK